MEHEAGVEPACFGVKTQRGYRQPTARVRLIWIRRQESNLRGLRSERSWDTDNPHLSNLAGRHGLEPCKAGFGDQPPPCGRPRIGGAHCCRHRYPCGHDAVSGRSRASLGLRSKIGGRRRARSPHPSGCLWLSRPRRAHARFIFQNGGWRSVSIHIPLPVPAGFKPAAHPVRFTIQNWRRAVSSNHTPLLAPVV